jgi:hypothetical protein
MPIVMQGMALSMTVASVMVETVALVLTLTLVVVAAAFVVAAVTGYRVPKGEQYAVIKCE